MTRVAYVCADPGVPAFGTKGASIHVQSVCRALLEAGCDVTALVAKRGGPSPAWLSAMRVVDLPRAEACDVGARELALAGRNDDIVHALADAGPFDLVYERASLWTVAPMAFAASAGVPSVLEVNAPLVEEQAKYRVLRNERLARRLFASALRTAGVVAAVSSEVAAWAAVTAGRSEHVHVVPNGVDVRRFARARRHDRQGGFVIGFVGTLKPWHGVDTLVEAFASVASRVPAASLLLVGDGPERERLESTVAALGLRSRVTFTGAVSHDDVPSWLLAMDVAVAPYPALDGFYFSPLKVMEYMAAALPVVASAIGQIGSVIDHGRTGVLVPAGDAAALAREIVALFEDETRSESLGRAACAHVSEHCTWASVVSRVLALAREAAGVRRATPVAARRPAMSPAGGTR
jgi:glycosyltransferase involved in cell wall biosynthesis